MEFQQFFAKHSIYPPVFGNEEKKVLEKFLVIKYERSSATNDTDGVRQDMFGCKQKSYDTIPPTRAAFGVPHKQCYLPNLLLLGSGNYPPNGSTEPL